MCMCKKYMCLISVMLLLGMAGSALADVNWTNGDGDRLWRNGANWDVGVPTGADKACIRQGGDGPIIDSSTAAVANNVVLGDHSSPGDTLDITGGSLTTGGWFILGYGASDDGTFNVSGGTTTVNSHMDVGFKGAGHLNMTSGTVTVNGTFGISLDSDGLGTSSGDVQLDGGTISCASLSILTGGVMDITGGTLIVDGDVTGTINIYKGDGRMTAYDGDWWVICDYNTTNTGKTTVTASETPPPSPPAPAFPPGDFDDDYDVDIDDVKLLADYWLSEDFPVDFDINDDDSINGVELAQIADYWRHESKNVVFIVIDDLNDTVGSYGHPVVQTPNMDALADRGMRFENALCNYAVCNPSRSSFLTGLRPDTTGIFGNRDYEEYADHLSHRVSLPRLFRNNGYYTKNLGKIFHTTSPEDQDVLAWDEINDYGATSLGNTGVGRNLTDGSLAWCRWLAANGDDEDQGDGRIAQQAVTFLNQSHDKPFFLAVGFHKPHDPFNAPASYFDLYPLEDCDPPVVPEEWEPLGRLNIPYSSMDDFAAFDDNDKREFLRAYYACTTFVDVQVGKVIQALEDNQLMDDTIIILFGDHGYHLGEHHHWNKVTVFGKCHRAPFMVVAPDAQAPAGSVTSEIIEFVDIYPTLADMCRLKNVPSDLEGISFQPLLDDPDMPWKEAGFIQVRRSDGMGRAVKNERWRYVEWEDAGQSRELYDTYTDPIEYVNLAGNPAYADVTLYLQELLHNGHNRFRVPGVDLIDGTFLHWKLDETTGAVAADDSANGFDGTLMNMDDSDWVLGNTGNALDFDGANDYVEVTGYTGVTSTQSRTCAAWIKTTGTGAIVSWGDSNISGGWWLFWVEGDGRLRLNCQGGHRRGNTDLRDNNWHHVAAVLADDGSPNNSEVKLYVDGVEETYSSVTSQPIYTASHSNVTIGASYIHDGSVVVPFTGRIDDVRIYDRALSETEITTLAQ